MGVVDDIKKAGSTVQKEASKFTRVQLEQRKLRPLQRDVAGAEQEAGALAYDLAERGDLAHPTLDAPLARIKQARAAAAEKEAEIAQLKAEISEEVGTTRDAYVERLMTQLGEWSADIERLKARASKVSADAKAEYEEQLADLRKQRDALAARVTDLQEASDEAWDDVKQAVQAAWDRAKESFQKTMARFGRDGGAGA
jgi:chromosome segregation ATPase